MKIKHNEQFMPLILIVARLNSFKGGVKLPIVNNTSSAHLQDKMTALIEQEIISFS